MFDSIDLGIKNIDIADFEYFIIDNISILHIPNILVFEYENIKFTYYLIYHFLLIHTNVHKLLNKTDITLKDKKQYITKLTRILNDVIINLENYNLDLMRIDYHVDVKLDDKVNDYINFLNKNVDVFKYMKKKKEYYTSIHLSTKAGKQNINIYNKYEESKSKKYNGILRVEIQCKKRLVKSELKQYGITRELDNYWDKNAMEQYFFSIVDDFCYKGNYYKRKKAYCIINNSDYTNSMKKKLKNFLLDVEKNGLAKMKNSKKYNDCKIKTRIEKLSALNINPIPIPIEFNYDIIENLPTLVRKTAREKYFIEN